MGLPKAEAASTTALQTAVVTLGLVATFAIGVGLALPSITSDPLYTLGGSVAVGILVAVALGMQSALRRPAVGEVTRPRRRLVIPPRLVPRLGRAAGWVRQQIDAAVDTGRTLVARSEGAAP